MPPTDVDDNLSKGPLTLKYMKILRWILMTTGGWADEPFGKKSPWLVPFQRKTFTLQILIFLSGSVYYVVHNFADIDLFVIGHVFITASLSILTVIRSILTNFKEYDLIIKNFVEFNLFNYRHKGPHYEEIYSLTEKACYYFTLFNSCMLILGPVLFNTMPIYVDYTLGAFSKDGAQNQSLDFAIFYEYPGYRQDDNFYLSTVFNIYLSFVCGALICTFDTLLVLIGFQIIGHIKTLMMDFENMDRPKTIQTIIYQNDTNEQRVDTTLEKFDREENAAIKIHMTEMINHHRQILRFAGRIADFFGPMLAFNFFYHLVTCCLLLLECSGEDPKTVARFGPLTMIIFGQLIELSVTFEIVGTMSEKLIDSVYYSPWECMDVPNQRTVRFLLQRVQNPIQVTAMGMVPVGVKTMQGIIKTTLSYFAILQSISK